MAMNKKIMASLVLAGVLGLSACGFHLRGGTVIPPQMKTLRIVGANPYGPLLRQLRPRFESAGVTLVKDKKKPAAEMRVYRDNLRKNVLSVGAKARVREFELLYDVEFAVFGVQGQALVPKQNLNMRREYSFDESELLGKAREEEFLRDEMYRQMADRVMARLGSVGR